MLATEGCSRSERARSRTEPIWIASGGMPRVKRGGSFACAVPLGCKPEKNTKTRRKKRPTKRHLRDVRKPILLLSTSAPPGQLVNSPLHSQEETAGKRSWLVSWRAALAADLSFRECCIMSCSTAEGLGRRREELARWFEVGVSWCS